MFFADLLRDFDRTRSTFNSLSYAASQDMRFEAHRPPKLHLPRHDIERYFTELERHVRDFPTKLTQWRATAFTEATQAIVSERIVMTLDAMNFRPNNPELFIPMLVAHILAQHPTHADFESACRQIEDEHKYRHLSIADFVAAVSKQKTAWQARQKFCETLPEQFAAAAADWININARHERGNISFQHRCIKLREQHQKQQQFEIAYYAERGETHEPKPWQPPTQYTYPTCDAWLADRLIADKIRTEHETKALALSHRTSDEPPDEQEAE